MYGGLFFTGYAIFLIGFFKSQSNFLNYFMYLGVYCFSIFLQHLIVYLLITNFINSVPTYLSTQVYNLQ